MPKILELNTQETLYPEPLEVSIDGKIFQVREVDLGTLEKIQEVYIEAQAGSAKAIRQILDLALGSDELFAKLKMWQLKKLVHVIVERSLNPDEASKNGQSPGEAGLP